MCPHDLKVTIIAVAYFFFTLKDSLGVLHKYQRTIIDILCVYTRLKFTIVTLIEVLLHLGTK